MKSLLSFDKMVTPLIIKILYWIGMVIVVITGIVGMFDDFWAGLATALLGPLVIRIYAEIILLVFSMHENIVEIKNSLKK